MRAEAMRSFFAPLMAPLLALLVGLIGALALTAVLGENPLNVLMVLLRGSFGSATQLGYSLYYATPLLLTGLSVAWASQAGLFNIGAEGQMALGGLAMSVTGILFPDLPAPLAIPFALFNAFLAGGVWGAFAGWIRARRGCHEVLATILLNFIAYGVSSYFILSVFKNPDSQVPETAPVGPSYQIAAIEWLGGKSPLNYCLFFAFALVALYGFVFRFTRLGFYQRMTGSAAGVAKRSGIDVERQMILSMFFAGGLAAMAAASPVLGFAYKTREGFTANAGFVGIAVALLGRNSPIGIALAALLFGALTKGALDLDLDTEFVSRDLATVIQAFIIIAVACHVGLSRRKA